MDNTATQSQQTDKPTNHGLPWSVTSDYRALLCAFQNRPIENLARELGRTPSAVAARLHTSILRRSGIYKDNIRRYLQDVDPKVYDYREIERYKKYRLDKLIAGTLSPVDEFIYHNEPAEKKMNLDYLENNYLPQLITKQSNRKPKGTYE